MAESICRLCLTTTLDNSTILEVDLKAALDNILVKSVLNFSQQQNMVCSECRNNLQTLNCFKRAIVNIRDETLPEADCKSGVSMDVKDIELIKFAAEQLLTCNFCTKIIEKPYFISLAELKQKTSLVNPLDEHNLELKFNCNKQVVSCESCHTLFQGLQNFIITCFNVEENIRKYAEVKGADANGTIDLRNVREYTLNPTLQQDIGCSSAIKMEVMDEDQELKSEPQLQCENEDLLSTIKHEEIEIKSERNESVESKGITKQISTYRDPLKRKIFACEKCTFETKYAASLKRHVLAHFPAINKDPLEIISYKCEMCVFETKHKQNMKRHMMTHKDRSERRKYKCKDCGYETIFKRSLKYHMMTHRDPSDRTMYRCEECKYETIRREDLKRHTLTHKDPSQRVKYKCQDCPYESISCSSMSIHRMTHMDPLKIPMHKCEMCTYETKLSKNLKRHMLIHDDGTVRKKYKCKYCEYETTRDSSMWYHMLSHKDPSELIIYKCEVCTYETTRKGGFKNHMLTHKDRSERRKLKCKYCPFEALTHSSMSYHKITHKDPLEVTIHKCKMCPYETKISNHLKRHLMTHEDPSMRKKYRCNDCGHETINKRPMEQHVLIHNHLKYEITTVS